MSFCPTKDIHSIYLDNELPENFKAEYELHLKNCPECQKELEKIKNLREAIQADAKSISPDEHFLDESFNRLQIKMTYSKNAVKTRKSERINYRYIMTASAAAVLVAVIIPVRLKNSVPQETAGTSTGTVAIGSTYSSSVPMISSNNSVITANNVSFDSGRSVLVSGNIQGTVLSSEPRRNRQATFTRNVRSMEVLRPDLENETNSIRITVPGVGDIPVSSHVDEPTDVMTGKF